MDILTWLIAGAFTYLVGWAIYWFFVAILCGVLARTKNRSFSIWFLLGFFFNLLALILLAFLPARKSRRSLKQGTIKLERPLICRNCGRQNSQARRDCIACGSPLNKK